MTASERLLTVDEAADEITKLSARGEWPPVYEIAAIIRRVHQPPTDAREEAERIVRAHLKSVQYSRPGLVRDLTDAIASALSPREDVAGLLRECKERMAECREALSVDPVDGPTYGLCLSIDDLLARIDAATGGPA